MGIRCRDKLAGATQRLDVGLPVAHERSARVHLGIVDKVRLDRYTHYVRENTRLRTTRLGSVIRCGAVVTWAASADVRSCSLHDDFQFEPVFFPLD